MKTYHFDSDTLDTKCDVDLNVSRMFFTGGITDHIIHVSTALSDSKQCGRTSQNDWKCHLLISMSQWEQIKFLKSLLALIKPLQVQRLFFSYKTLFTNVLSGLLCAQFAYIIEHEYIMSLLVIVDVGNGMGCMFVVRTSATSGVRGGRILET